MDGVLHLAAQIGILPCDDEAEAVNDADGVNDGIEHTKRHERLLVKRRAARPGFTDPERELP